MMMAPGMIQAFAEGKLAFLKSLLGITEAQSGSWNAFAEVVRAQAKSMAEAQQKRMPTPGQPELTLPQWVDLHLQMMEEHLAAMKKIKPAFDALLPSADTGAAAEGRSTHPHGLIIEPPSGRR